MQSITESVTEAVTVVGLVCVEALEIESQQPPCSPIDVPRPTPVEEGQHVVRRVSGLRSGELGPRPGMGVQGWIGLTDDRRGGLTRDGGIEPRPIATPLLDDESPRRVVGRVGESLLVRDHPRVELTSLRREPLALDRPHHEAGSASSSRSTIGPNSSGYRACGLCSS